MVTWSVLGVATLVVGGPLGLLAIAVWRNHDGPGATALTITFAALAVWPLAYGTNVLVFDAGLSRLLEIPFWIAGEVFTVAFLFFSALHVSGGEVRDRHPSLLPATSGSGTPSQKLNN